MGPPKNDTWKKTLLAGPALENERGVGAAKSEGIRERVFHRGLARFVRNVVEIAGAIRRFLVYRRPQNPFAYTLDTESPLPTAPSPQHTPLTRPSAPPRVPL